MVDRETDPRDVEAVCEDVHDGMLYFSGGALRPDLRAVIRGGRVIWVDEH
jgi:hypothetical protein